LKVDAFDTWLTVSRPPHTTTAPIIANTRLFLYGGGALERADLGLMADTFLVFLIGPAKLVRRVRRGRFGCSDG